MTGQQPPQARKHKALTTLLPASPCRSKATPLLWLLTVLFGLGLFMMASCSESPKQTARRLDLEAKQCLEKNQYAKAIELWNKVRRLDPETHDLDINLAKAYRACGQYGNALTYLEKHLKKYPGSTETLISILTIQLQLFDLDGADRSWKKLRALPASPRSLVAHGDLLALHRQYQNAARQYRKALETAPAFETALARLAVLLQGMGSTEEAEKYYRELEKLNPSEPEILLQMSNYLLLAGQPEQARRFVRNALAQDPDDQPLLIKLARIYLGTQKYSEAASIFSHLLSLEPTNRYYKKMLLESLLQGQQYAEAKILIEKLSPMEDREIDFLTLRGKYYLHTGNYLLAVSQLERAIEQEPTLPIPYYFLALAYMASGQNNLGHRCLIKCLSLNRYFTPAELTLADYYYSTKEYDLAMEHAQRVLAREPENARAFLIKGNILLARKMYEKAINSFSKAYALNPAPSSLYALATATLLKGSPEKSFRLLEKLLAHNASLADATLLFCQLSKKQGTSVIKLLKRNIANHPDNPYLHHIMGLVLLDNDDKEHATRSFRKALQINPRMREPYLQLFDLYESNQGLYQEILEEAVTAIPDFEEALIRLASLYTTNGTPEKGITLLQQALARTPDSPTLANNLAWLYQKFRPDNIDEALRLASNAYDQQPDNPAIADTLGWIYYQKNLYTRARWLLEEAQQKQPASAEILDHLEATQRKLRQPDPSTKSISNQEGTF